MTIFHFEWLKIIKNKTILGSFLAGLIVLSGILFVGFVYTQSYYANDINVKLGYSRTLDAQIKEKYTGDLTDDLVENILSDYLNQEKTHDYTSRDNPFYPFYPKVAETFVDGGLVGFVDKIEKESSKSLTISDFHLKKVSEVGFLSTSEPLKLGNFIPWADYFKVVGQIFILVNVLVVIVCALIFADDTGKNINQLLFTTKYGRSKLISKKIITGFSISFVLLILFQTIGFLVFSLMCDTTGGISSIQTNFSMNLLKFPFAWSHWDVFGFVLFVEFFGVCFTASISMFISSLSKTTLTALITGISVLLFPKLLKEVIRSGFLNKILDLFPINFSDPNYIFSKAISNEFFVSSFTYNFMIIGSTLVIVSIIMVFFTYAKMRSWKFK